MHNGSMMCVQSFINWYLDEKAPLKIIDIGSYDENGSYKELFDKPNWTYIGMDVRPGPNVDIVGYEDIPEKYDVLVSGQVMEHVNHPWDWVKNLKNYVADKGLICIVVPFWGREHRSPIDTYRYLPDGMRDLFEYADIFCEDTYRFDINTVGIGRVNVT